MTTIFRIQNPITKKRLQRFRKKRRAFWSFWILVSLYVLSLCSELICNDKPLYVHFNGRHYFPIFHYQPENTFLHNNRFTRTDYKALLKLAAFTNTPGNRMVFPLIPFGPYETIAPSSILTNNFTAIRLTPQQHIGSIDILPDLTIQRAISTEFFFGQSIKSTKGTSLTTYWHMTNTLSNALTQRFENKTSHRLDIALQSVEHPKKYANITLPAFKPRRKPPRTVRITFRDRSNQKSTAPITINLRTDGTLEDPSEFYDSLSQTDRQKLTVLATEPQAKDGRHSALLLDGITYHILSATPGSIQWPYPPTSGHWFGIDSAGRDVLVRIIYGFRTSMTFGILLVIGAMVTGTMIGSIQGYFAGRIDITVQRFIEIWSALPFLYIMILIGSIYGRSFAILLFVYGLFNWVGISYYVRAEFLQLRQRAFIDAARCMGIPSHRIMFKHILPNALTPIITFFPFALVGAIGALAALDYLGFGLPPPTPSWGEMFHQAQTFRWAWWLICYPGAALCLVVFLSAFVGEGIRDAFDPKPHARIK